MTKPISKTEKYKRGLQKSVKKLKLSTKVADLLVKIGTELHEAYMEQLEAQDNTIQAWERLYLDQPEDRLYHAKDKTWWRRMHGTEKEFLKATRPDHKEYNLYRAEPPEEVMRLAKAAHAVLSRIRRLNKPHLMELWNALKPFDVIPVALYVAPYIELPKNPKMSEAGSKPKKALRRGRKA